MLLKLRVVCRGWDTPATCHVREQYYLGHWKCHATLVVVSDTLNSEVDTLNNFFSHLSSLLTPTKTVIGLWDLSASEQLENPFVCWEYPPVADSFMISNTKREQLDIVTVSGSVCALPQLWPVTFRLITSAGSDLCHAVTATPHYTWQPETHCLILQEQRNSLRR